MLCILLRYRQLKLQYVTLYRHLTISTPIKIWSFPIYSTKYKYHNSIYTALNYNTCYSHTKSPTLWFKFRVLTFFRFPPGFPAFWRRRLEKSGKIMQTSKQLSWASWASQQDINLLFQKHFNFLQFLCTRWRNY